MGRVQERIVPHGSRIADVAFSVLLALTSLLLLEESRTTELDPDDVPDSWPDDGNLARALDRYGTPLRDELFPSVVKPLSREARERAARTAGRGTEL